MFEPALVAEAASLLEQLRARKLMLATAESCTGGLIAALLTELPGSSDVVERGFVTYSNAAKAESIGVPAALIDQHGAVSAEVADAMAEGALAHSRADIAVAVTGVAGPGASERKPAGLVHLAVRTRGGAHLASTLRLGDIGRSAIRMATVHEALRLVRSMAETADQAARP